MKARLVRHIKVVDEDENILEIKIWKLPEPTKDKPHGFKYSFVYIVNGERIIGYDNTEGKGDHRHYKGKEEPYTFKDIDKLFEDFYKDIRRVKDESQKSQSWDKKH